MNLTIYEIAEKAGVSIATVSRALNAETRSKVSPETLKRVDAVIAKHQYRPNLAAKGLTQQVYRTIGVMIPHGQGTFYNDYYVRILGGISDALLDTDYRFKMLMLKCHEPWDRYNFRSAESVDGVIVTHWHAFFSDKKVFKQLGIPCVILGDPEKGLHAHIVSGDQAMGGRLAAEYFYQRGHRRMAVITGSPCSMDSAERLEGFQKFLKEKKITVDADLVVCGDFQEEKGKAAAVALLKTGKKFSALFCLNDAMAFGALAAFREQGIECPADISVIGFDDEARARESRPALTTVRVPLNEIARAAALILTAHLKAGKHERPFEGQVTLLPVTLVERASVAKK